MNIVKPLAKFFKTNGSLILSLTASAGVAAAAILTADSALKVSRFLNDIPESQLKTKAAKLKILKICTPPILTGVGTIGCIIGAYCLNKRMQLSLISAYGVLDAAFKSYREKMSSENLSEVDVSIRNDLARDKTIKYMEDLLNAPHTEEMSLWVDDYHDEPYWAKESDILRAMQNVNKEIFEPCMHKGYATLDEFYGLIPECEIEHQSRSLGWSYDKMIEDWDCYMFEVFWDDIYLIDDGKTLCAKNTLPKDYRGSKISVNYLIFNIPPSVDFLDFA